MGFSRLLIADILEISREVGDRLRRHEPNIHGFDVVLDGIGFSEIEPAHWVKLLIRRSCNDCDGFFHDPSLVMAWFGAGALHVDHGMSFDVCAGQALFGHSLAVVGVNRTV